MGLSKEDILQRLQPYGVECHEHDAVMTCETQAAALSSVPGQVTKNLFLRDKKRRQYLITALPDTKVDIKVLSSRLGLGKGGVSWGSPELLQEALQVEPGCVTPLALANDTTKHCVLLLDQNIKALGEAGKIFVHPIVNTASVAIAVPQLEAFLRSIGREPVYVDLEADPKIDKDNPPDLKQYADAVEPPPKVEGQEDQPAAAAANSTKTTAVAAAAGGTGAVAAAGSSSSSKKSSSKAPKAAKGAAAAAPSNAEVHLALTDVQTRTEELLNMVTSALLGQANISGVETDPYVLRRLRADLQMQLTAFKNAAYTSGYQAAKEEMVAHITDKYKDM